MKRIILPAILIAVLLGGCGQLAAQPTASPEQIATQVSAVLTTMPTTTTVVLPTSESKEITEAPTEAPAAPTATATSPAPTETQAPTQTPTVENTPAPTATVPASDPKLKLGNASFTDTFNDGKNWPLGEDKYTSAEVSNGVLKFTALTKIDGWRIAWPDIQDVYMEMTAKTGECSASEHYGLMLRVPDKVEANAGYMVGISCDGKFSLRKWDGEKMTSLIAWKADSAIVSGANQTNRLGIWAKGSQLVVYVNGVKVGEASDTTFTGKGGFGIFVGGSPENGKFTVNIDEISYWENP